MPETEIVATILVAIRLIASCIVFVVEILISAGKTLADAMGVARWNDVPIYGHALQCLEKTEDPQNSFILDYDRNTADRSAIERGIMLAGGTIFARAVITFLYGSLLARFTAFPICLAQGIDAVETRSLHFTAGGSCVTSMRSRTSGER